MNIVAFLACFGIQINQDSEDYRYVSINSTLFYAKTRHLSFSHFKTTDNSAILLYTGPG